MKDSSSKTGWKLGDSSILTLKAKGTVGQRDRSGVSRLSMANIDMFVAWLCGRVTSSSMRV